MLLVFGDEHKEHLELLKTLSCDAAREFCRISMEFLKKGTNSKVYQSAAQKLEAEPDAVQKAIEGLMFILLESSKRMLNDIDFQDSLKNVGFSEELQKELLGHYIEHRTSIRLIQKELSMDLPHYRNLEWRFDVQVASRCLHNQIEPVFTLKLHLEDGPKRDVVVMEADAANLVHLTQTLEDALQELNTPHCRRIMRNL